MVGLSVLSGSLSFLWNLRYDTPYEALKKSHVEFHMFLDDLVIRFKLT